MKMRKFLSFILSCTMCFAVGAAAGCGSSAPAPVVERLEIESTNLVLALGDKVELPISYNEIEGQTVVWTSSSPSVVSVDANGVVDALKVGAATITAQYGSKEVSCRVEVSLSGNVPVLAFASNVHEEITLLKGAEYALGACVQFNGKTFTDAEIEYFVADTSIGEVVDGKFVAKDVVGTTQVSVFATWRGQTVHARTISVTVIPESTVLLNGGVLTSVEIYTASSHEGVEYATEQTISSVFVSEDGNEVQDYTLSILDEGIASLSKVGDFWKITANKAGKTSLIVAYGNRQFYFDVNVVRPVKTLDLALDYSIVDAKAFDEVSGELKPVDEIVEGFEGVVSYVYNGKEYKLKDGVLNISESEGNVITLYNESVGYQMVCNVYTQVIDELQDFESIYAGTETRLVTGSYALAKDIIEPETVLAFPEDMKPNNFGGYFDGKGHVLSFTFIHSLEYRVGLFGQFLNGATIKNLALYNVTQSATSAKAPAGILCGEGGTNDSAFSFLENIYAEVKFSEKGQSNIAFMGNAMWKVNLNNVIVYAPDVPVTDTYGSFARGEVASTSSSYVISPAPIYVTNEPTATWRVLPTLYADYATFKNAGLDFDSFSVEFWDVETYGVPVWKTLVDAFDLL